MTTRDIIDVTSYISCTRPESDLRILPILWTCQVLISLLLLKPPQTSFYPLCFNEIIFIITNGLCIAKSSEHNSGHFFFFTRNHIYIVLPVCLPACLSIYLLDIFTLDSLQENWWQNKTIFSQKSCLLPSKASSIWPRNKTNLTQSKYIHQIQSCPSGLTQGFLSSGKHLITPTAPSPWTSLWCSPFYLPFFLPFFI